MVVLSNGDCIQVIPSVLVLKPRLVPPCPPAPGVTVIVVALPSSGRRINQEL
jgi:hypothetical protein